MKIKSYLLTVTVASVLTSAGFAQTTQQRKQIVQNYNLQKLQKLSTHFKMVSEKQRQEAYAYADAHNIPVIKEDADGNKSYLVKKDHLGNLIYYKSNSLDQIKTISSDQVYPGGEVGLELEGEGMTGGVWDGGKVRATHELLDGKVTQQDNASSYDDHATHVSGSFVGKKLNTGQAILAQGIAYEADLDAYDWYNDASEMSSAGQGGLLVSNHSYGIDLDQVPDPSAYLGKYGPTSKNIDNISYLAPKYTIVVAAGNDRGAGYNPADNGFNLLGAEMTTAKNDIVVAAVEKVLDYTGPSSVEMSTFSSWGPTSDRRIKPDISADGVAVFSSVAHGPQGGVSDDSYASFNGTSMASPSVAGGILLLQELNADLHDGDFMRSATAKAIAIETARETGSSDGPDPKFGWGLLNVGGAAQLMIDDANQSGSFYDELDLQDGDTYTYDIESNGEPMKVTIAWTDPAGDTQTGGSNAPVLVNDLDLRIEDSEGNTYYPWRLHPFNNNSPALNDDDNDVDNVEQVFIPETVEGETYTVTVSHKDDLKYGHQEYSIAAMGSKPLSVKSHALKETSIYPNPAINQFNLDIKKAGSRVSVAVYDLNGRQVIQKDFTGAGHFNQSVDVSDLTSGVYFVKIETNGKRATKKLIVQ